ncbi:MAG: sugar phosphorylase [Fibrobacteria bacterium]|nr:sugar phosphorylase [Fibrobacteria bacterium]
MGFEDKKQKIAETLSFIYGEQIAVEVVPRIEKLCKRYVDKRHDNIDKWSQEDVFLISYGDSISQAGESPLKTLATFLDTWVKDKISFLHILPFFPYTSDDGFSVVDYRQVNTELGNWDDIKRLGNGYRLVFDAVINHVSASSDYMLGQCKGEPQYKNFLHTVEPEADLSSVLRPRTLPLTHAYDTWEGEQLFWTTFSKDQIDLNFQNPNVLLEILDVLLFYACQGASMIRLDAIPYLWKELGTTCAHLPRTHAVVKLMREVYDAVFPEVILLSETNVPHQENLSYFGNKGDEAQVIYNFTLPPLVLYSIHNGTASKLSNWAASIEKISDDATYLNITATHDGIGLRPAEGILTVDELKALGDLAKNRGGNIGEKTNSDGTISPYELNITFFDILNAPSSQESLDLQINRFMLSQTIPMCLMGIPGIYIHSLLGSRNDLEGVQKTGVPRSINRKKLDINELEKELAEPDSLRSRVLARYLSLLSIRQKQNAFHPNALQEVLELGEAFFAVKRTCQKSEQVIHAIHNVNNKEAVCVVEELTRRGGVKDLLSGESFSGTNEIPLAAYQVRWLTGEGDI